MAKADVDAWCGPTRVLESAQLAELVHQTKPAPAAMYPVYRHDPGAVRIAIGIAVLAMIAIGVLMTFVV